ncbi:hypothetical protein [Deinococcus cellulosilyticus]|uniref:MYXO-CTERM domain-containing protein n=1 Tax=Deinococcus cellulosilyticus (strain DSM 18568 / NBRC 106333 / KACC 11606 / 5516J-15) TaxID=1223518 RepID=A0A511N5K2_DEIC1|nr:hypothetical protein [Deinococcus cellulosilyticus]GEM47706.1 hypothetical protein DC3_33410 [Deinococcus cellulosilyticus NBRC 106333 = KACC 11606]
MNKFSKAALIALFCMTSPLVAHAQVDTPDVGDSTNMGNTTDDATNYGTNNTTGTGASGTTDMGNTSDDSTTGSGTDDATMGTGAGTGDTNTTTGSGNNTAVADESYARDDNSFPWGILGLLGLAGLAGRSRHDDRRDARTTARP